MFEGRRRRLKGAWPFPDATSNSICRRAYGSEWQLTDVLDFGAMSAIGAETDIKSPLLVRDEQRRTIAAKN
jgi:hypothetical protein